jgi:hypothetical protein
MQGIGTGREGAWRPWPLSERTSSCRQHVPEIIATGECKAEQATREGIETIVTIATPPPSSSHDFILESPISLAYSSGMAKSSLSKGKAGTRRYKEGEDIVGRLQQEYGAFLDVPSTMKISTYFRRNGFPMVARVAELVAEKL